MKIKSIFASMLAVLALASCSKDDAANEGGPGLSENGIAYFSLNVQTPTGVPTRTDSSEEPEEAGSKEGAINSLSLIAFNGGTVVVAKGEEPVMTIYAAEGQTVPLKPEPFCVNPTTTGILVIANPGAKLTAFLRTVTEGTTFDAINAAIKDADVLTELTGSSLNHFTMINSGANYFDKTNPNNSLANLAVAEPATDVHNNALVSVVGKIQVVGIGDGKHATIEDAKAAAGKDENRVKVLIERLSSKVTVKTGSVNTDRQDEDGTSFKGYFKHEGWVLDVLNTTFYPWAKKVQLGTNHSGSTYTNNFYTMDPNFSREDNNDNLAESASAPEGIVYNSVFNANGTFGGILDVEWKADGGKDYCIENTMTALAQKFKNATRVIVRATYFPDENWQVAGKDWFSLGKTAYEDFDALKAAYVADKTKDQPDAEDQSALVQACNTFYTVLNNYALKTGNEVDKTDFPANDFEGITQSMLNHFKYGGEVVREDNCIRWYPKGICYYWYEIRHDKAAVEHMEFAKYGNVRNNFYALTITSANHWGTPWYPNVDPKDPKDPEGPEGPDPIDQEVGYLGIEVEVAPWIKWDYEIGW